MDKTLYIDAQTTENGDLEFDVDYLRLNVRALWKAGSKVIVRVQTKTAKRSLAANNFYWAVLVDSVADYTGYNKKEVHAILKEKFAKEQMFVVNEKTGEILEESVPMLTRTMTKQRFHQFIDECIQFAVSLGIRLPMFEGDQYAYQPED